MGISSSVYRCAAVFALLLLALLRIPPLSAAATPEEEFWVANGAVYASALSGNTLYIGGDFTYIGPNTGGGTLVDAQSGLPDEDFPLINGQVYAAEPDGAEGWYLGGTFTSAAGTAVGNIVHLIPDPGNSSQLIVDTSFTPDVINTGMADARIDTMLLSGSTLYIGGVFDQVDDGSGAVARNNIAALDATDGSLQVWDPSADGQVAALVLSDDGNTLFAGGGFANIGGAAHNGIVALDADATTAGNAVGGWNANAAAGTTVNTVVLAPSGRLFLGGAFSTIDATVRNNLAAVDPADGSLVSGWDPGPNDTVYDLMLSNDGSLLYVAGAFNTDVLSAPSIGNESREYLARVATDNGAIDTDWTPATNGPVRMLELLGSAIVLSGEFTSVEGEDRDYIARVTVSSGALVDWAPDAEAIVRVVKRADLQGGGSILFAGGDFVSIGGGRRNHIAALDIGTGQTTGWNPDVDDIVRAIAPSATSIYIGGDFTAVGGRARNHFASLDPSSGAARTSWDLNVNNVVHTLLLQGTTLYAGGAFTKVGSVTRNRIAAFDTETISVTGFAPTVADGVVYDMVLSSDDPALLYIGGSFTQINNTTRNRLAAVNTDTAALSGWDPNVTGNSVRSVVLSTDTNPVLYAGGDFTTVGASARANIAAIKTSDGTVPGSWVADNADGIVRTLALADDDALLYAGGDFAAIGGEPTQTSVAALLTADGTAIGWDPVPGAPGGASNDDRVRALSLASGGTLYTGGDFSAISGVLRYHHAVFEAPQSSANPAGGNFNAQQNVELTCTDKAGADCTDAILYSTDGSDPGTAYSSGMSISINATTTLKFFSTDSEGMREVINTAAFVIDTTAPTTSPDPQGGTYTEVQEVALQCSDADGSGSDADVSGCVDTFYTTDGSDPTTNSQTYSEAIELEGDTVLKFFSVDSAGNSEQIKQESYIIDAVAPVTTTSPEAGRYTTPQTVTLNCDDGPGFGCVDTFYTTDGTVPSNSSTRYTSPILIESNTTLNFFSTDNAGHSEAPKTAVFLIETGEQVTTSGGLFATPVWLVVAGILVFGRVAWRRHAGA